MKGKKENSFAAQLQVGDQMEREGAVNTKNKSTGSELGEFRAKQGREERETEGAAMKKTGCLP